MKNLGYDVLAAISGYFVFWLARLMPNTHSVFDPLTLQIP